MSDSKFITWDKLIHSNVWGVEGAVTSVNGFCYYVSFIDDYSRYTWVYPLKYKSNVVHVFLQFQYLVQRLLNKKIISVQTYLGDEYRKLHSFFQQIGIQDCVSFPHAHQQNSTVE